MVTALMLLMKLLLPRLLLLHDSSRLYRSSACFGGDKGNCRGSSKSSCSSALLLSDAANTEDFSLILYNNPADYLISSLQLNQDHESSSQKMK